ncbi:MAG: TnsA-like heteromeric transposase endonuclease subunit [Kineosporiaceae bacterium]|nr:TnsA-like heteromeric transposase endonuclease subunit [Aeromicrobium sp.]
MIKKKQPNMVLSSEELKIDSVRWIDSAGTVQQRAAGPVLFDVGIVDGRPVRKPGRYRGQKNYPGKHWFASSGLHVPFESMLERSALMRIDFALDVVAIAAQPVRISFADGGSAVPDFLAQHRDGTQTVFEVKVARALTAEKVAKFDRSKQVCNLIGWGFEILTECEVVMMDNLELLAGFRNPLYFPVREVRERILSAARTLVTLREGAIASGLPIRDGYAAVYHLAWNREVGLDLTVPISNNSIIAA